MCKVSMSHGCKVQPQILCFKVIQLLASFRTLAKSSSKSTNPCTNSGHEKGRQCWPLSIMALSMHIRDQLQENGRVSQSFERGLMRTAATKTRGKSGLERKAKQKPIPAAKKQKLAFCGAGRTCVASRWLLLIALHPGSICEAYSPRAGGRRQDHNDKAAAEGSNVACWLWRP